MTGQQLKNSILQMAVQGKLVPQDPNDEPASVLLERIRKEKEQLIKEGKIKKEKNPSYIFRGAENLPYEKVDNKEPVCIADEVPFEIPDSWEWVRISSLGSIIRGSGIKRVEIIPDGKPCVRYGELYTTYNIYFTQAVSFISEESDGQCKHFSCGDILMTLTGENKPDIAKAVAYLGVSEIAAGGDLAFWTAHGMNPLYLTYLMASPYVIGRKIELATGDIIVHISGNKLGTILIPVPPLSEQQRIVDKILEAEAKLVEYSKKEFFLNDLQKNFPDTLKKSILQDAVQGKLVPQDENDEPASVLLEHIQAEKQKLIAEGKIKKDKHESVIFRRDNSHYEIVDGIERCIDDELPFEIPDNWEWVRLGEISTYSHTKLKISAQNAEPQMWELDLEDVEKGGKILEYKTVGERKAVGDKTFFDKGDILYSKLRPYLLKVLVAPDCGICTPEIVPFKVYGNICSEFMVLFLKSPYVNEVINSATYGVKMPRVGTKTMNSLIVPLPPLDEQHRIVAKFDVLLNQLNNL